MTPLYAVTWRLGLLAWLVLAWSASAMAQAPGRERTLVLQHDTQQVRLGHRLDVLEDAERRLRIGDVIALGDALPWRASGQAVPSFGLSASAHWLRLRYENRADPQQAWLLALAYAPLQHVELYLQMPDGTVRALQGGSALPVSQRPMVHARHVFPLSLPAQGTLWIRAYSAGSVSLPLTLWEPAAFHRHDGLASLAQGAFIGLMLALLVVNLVVGMVSRESVHFMYFVSSASYVAYFVSAEGLGELYLWPATPAWSLTVKSVAAALGGATLCLFTHQVLEFSRLRTLTGKLLRGLAALCILLALADLVDLVSYRTGLTALLALIGSSCLLLPLAALQAHRRGVPVARYLLLGWMFLLMGVFVTVLRLVGVVPAGLLTENAASLGFASGTMLLTMALAVRLRQLKSENEAALAEQLRARNAAAQAREQALLAEVRAGKAAGLAEALATLEELGRIGREITGNLDGEAVFSTLRDHLQRLMDARAFALLHLDQALATRSLVYGVEDGRRLPVSEVRLSPDDPAYRCVRERRAVRQALAASGNDVAAGTAQTPSSMHAPLHLGERLLGVLMVQSARADAYGEREVAIFETLCAYAAIALANAETFQALRAAQAQIVQQEKMVSLAVLTAGMAHEINNPAHFARLAGQNAAAQVEALRAFIDSLLGDDTDPAIAQAFGARFDQIRASLQTSAEGIERIAQVIRRLRAESPEGAGFAEGVDLVALLESAWQTFTPSARVELAVTTAFACRPTRACAVAEVKQLFIALLGNARDAVEAAQRPGRVELSACERATARGPEAVIEVRDNGCGIAPQHLDRVFDPFFTTKPVGQGMGLGLSMARDTALRHGWQLQVASTAGEGSVFSLVMPLRAQPAAAAAAGDGSSAHVETAP